MSNKELRAGRRPRERSAHLSPDAAGLVTASLGLANSGSRFEDRFWEQQLARLLDRALDAPQSSAIESALERLNQTDGEGYGTLIEAAESASETVVLAPGRNAEAAPDARHEGLLVMAPLVVWTRFSIPSGPLSTEMAAQLNGLWRALILAPGVEFRMVPWLYSLDQLPREYQDVRRLTRRLTQAAVAGTTPRMDFRSMPETAEMLADSRFVIGAIVSSDSASPVFRWQLSDSGHASRVQCLEQWTEQVRPLLEPMLPGCGFECLLPDAYNINLRESDRRVRPYGIKAAVHYLTHVMNLEASQIVATVAAFGEGRIDEYRIGLSVGEHEDVVRGVIWPLLGAELETDDPSPVERIRETLREVGVTDVRVWAELTQSEYCEDCGAPLFPGPNNEVVHMELPEEPEPASGHFH